MKIILLLIALFSTNIIAYAQDSTRKKAVQKTETTKKKVADKAEKVSKELDNKTDSIVKKIYPKAHKVPE